MARETTARDKLHTPEEEPDDLHAFHEQWKEVEYRYNPRIVTLRQEKPSPGALARIVFELDIEGQKHPISGQPAKFYVHGANEELLTRTDRLSGSMDILPGYPTTRPRVRFLNGQIPKQINVFTSGSMCIGSSDETVLSILLDNIFKACIYDPDPSVANYDSMADSTAKDWQKDKEATREFPIINPKLLLRLSNTDRSPADRAASTSLPPVKHAENTGLPPVKHAETRHSNGLAPIRR